MRKPRKPTLKKRPKMPKKGSSLEVHERWAQRAADVEKENKKKMGDYKKALNSYYAAQRKKESLRKKYAQARPY